MSIARNVIHATADRFTRLKALQRPSNLPLSTHTPGPVRSPLEQECSGYPSGIGLGSERLAEILGASVKRNQNGEHLSLHCWHREHAPCTPDAAALRLLAPDAPEDVADTRQWLFLDTETTGLAGGTGTYPFLVGLAWWEGGGLEVEQLFMREYSEERSLLAALAERLAERPVLVTFNGKSFDWPLLETRYRMTRTISPPALRAHLDFLHPARNLWRRRLGSVRLSQLERHVLGWDRGADLMSGLIPRNLSRLCARRARGPARSCVPAQSDGSARARRACGARPVTFERSGINQSGRTGVVRCVPHLRAARRGKACPQTIRTVDCFHAANRNRSCCSLGTRTAGKARRGPRRARELWESTLGNSREGYDAYEQLAIYYEHEAREPRQALAIVCQALALLRNANQAGTIAAVTYRRAKARFELRLVRLERKAGRTLLDSF